MSGEIMGKRLSKTMKPLYKSTVALRDAGVRGQNPSCFTPPEKQLTTNNKTTYTDSDNENQREKCGEKVGKHHK